ncbi:GNAT family N-acetyltransferase [Catenuloplanes sp. NPDC051500]|uniref:GNAT family N-acetyltransferase n=1 Tax=Catenuloplanes sp. NPDC051500 TaxID=3363959 RepID=UPI0037A9E6CF
MTAMTVRRYGPREAAQSTETLVGVHAEVHAGVAWGDDPYFSTAAFRRRWGLAVRQPGFELLLAEVDGEAAGLLYGWPLPFFTRWWQPLAGQLPAEMTTETGRRSVFIQEIMVRAPWRRRGIGRRLHDGFLTGRPEQRALLCVLPENEPAHAAYRRWGWGAVARAATGAGEPTFDWMLRELPGPRPAPGISPMLAVRPAT